MTGLPSSTGIIPCPLAGGVPQTEPASQPFTARLLRMQSEIQADGYGRMRRMRQSRFIETVS
jgi:hypothetical protein